MTIHEKSGGERQRVPRAYLDTNLVIGMREQDLGADQEPLRRILFAYKRGSLELVTSPVTPNEIQKGDVPEVDEVIYLLLRLTLEPGRAGVRVTVRLVASPD